MFSLFILFAISSFLVFRRDTNLSERLGYVSAICLSIVGVAVPYVWNWSRFYGTPGLLPSHFLSKADVSTFNFLFSLAALGCFLSALMFTFLKSLSDNKNCLENKKLDLSEVRDSKFIPCFGVLTLLCLLLGLGRSALSSEVYLSFSGSQTLLRAANALLPASLISLGFAVSKSKYRLVNQGLLISIFLVQTGRGSRVILIVPAVLAVILFQKTRSTLGRIGSLFFTFFLSLILIEVIFSARKSSSGLLGLPGQILNASNQSINPTNFIPSFGRLLSSLTSWAPTVISSIPEASKGVILNNLNPLIGSGSDSMSYSSEGLERLFPYIWIPLSSLGQIYGAFGGVALTLIMFLIATIAALSLYQGKRSDSLSVFSLLSVGTYVFQFPLFFQYSSRIWLRVLWLMLLLTTLHLFVHLRKSTKLEMQRRESADD